VGRPFDYPLEPRLEQLRWQKQRCLDALARTQQVASARKDEWDALDSQCEELARNALPASAARVDIAARAGALAYLTQLAARRAEARSALQQAKEQVDRAKDDLSSCLMAIDQLDNDRALASQDHRREQERVAAREADRDWAATRHVRGSRGS